MNWTSLPLLELTLLLPLIGAVITFFVKTPTLAARFSLAILVASLAAATLTNLAFPQTSLSWTKNFAVDDLAAPMLPALGLLHLITLLGTAKSRVSAPFCVRILLSAFLSYAAVTCRTPRMLAALLILGVFLPLWDLRSRRQPLRGYLLHMGLFVTLLLLSWQFEGQKASAGLLLVALLLRGGILPLHGWLPTLFRGAAYGTAIVFVLPMMEVLVALRIALPATPEWMLDAAGVACLVTAVYGGGMAIVQNEARKFFAHLCLSQTALVMFAVMQHTSNSLTAALCLWISSSLALAGLSFSVRSLEARFGALSLREYHGYYEQVPNLAICFLIAGLACVGFPGTIGFVPMELLITSSVGQGLGISFTLAVATMLNGIAILRAYFALFTGKRPTTSVSLQITTLERAGIVVITLVVFLGAWFSPVVVASRHKTADNLLKSALR